MADSFQENINGVVNLVDSDINKNRDGEVLSEGVGTEMDEFELKLDDEELLQLSIKWQRLHDQYFSKIKSRQQQNKLYYLGREIETGLETTKGVSSNLIFEAEETFIPQALSRNPEPVVWSDNTTEGKEASTTIKTMLQSKADTMVLRRKLGVMLRHWSIYFLGILKHGWDEKVDDISLSVKNPRNFIFDPEAYIDEYGRYIGAYLGERVSVAADDAILEFPKKKAFISSKVKGKLGTKIVYTEWWTDEYCFYTFEGEVLDKNKNPFFNYPTTETQIDEFGQEEEIEVKGKNHFAEPIMPYTFLSVFTFQEQPHDVTNLIEQSIPNQDRIVDRDLQISRNVAASNNSIVLSGPSFTAETARQAARALEDGDPVLVPDGEVDRAIRRLPASPLPGGLLESQNIDKMTLRSIFGTQGLTPQPQSSSTTVRGLIINQNQDSSRIGGGMGEALEQVADNIFNWWVQLFYVFYDVPHFAAVMGADKAVQYVQLVNTAIDRHFVVSVVANSMTPKDEITEMNMAIDLASRGWLDPINLFKRLNFPDPQETARMVTLFKIDPLSYYQTFFGEGALPRMAAPAQGEGMPPEITSDPMQGMGLSEPPKSADLSQVPINGIAP